MPLDQARVEDTRAWLRKARQDSRAAEIEFGADPPLLEDVLFHCQQAAEKALKALLTWHDQPFRKTHDLAELGLQCAEVDPSLEALTRRAETLTVYAWIFRYPGRSETPGRDEVELAMRLAGEILDVALAKLPQEVRP